MDVLSTVETAASKTNLVLEHVQVKQHPQPAPIVVPAVGETVATTPMEQQPKEEAKPVEESVKPNPFGFELPVLRSVSAAQIPPPIVRQEPELVLPTLRPVPVSSEPQEVVESNPVQWELPPLDSRPNLQALLEREKQAAEAAINDQLLKQRHEEHQRKQQEELQRKQQEELQRKQQLEEHQRKQQELLRQQQAEQQKVLMQQQEQQKQQQMQLMQQQEQQKQEKLQLMQQRQKQQQILMNEEMRMIQEAQLAKLSVRLKVQRFESTGPPAPVSYVGHVSVSQSTSPRLSGISSPVLTGRNKPQFAPNVMQTKVPDPRPAPNTKENVPSTHSPTVPSRKTEVPHHIEPTTLPKVAQPIQPPLPAVKHLAPIEPLAPVQLRQPSGITIKVGKIY